jgi:hypothetical protein
VALPKEIAACLSVPEVKALDGSLASDRECEGARFHSPQPLVLHEIKVGKRKAYLCGVCRDNLSVLDALTRSQDGDLAWPVRREFGNQIRALHKEMTGHG